MATAGMEHSISELLPGDLLNCQICLSQFILPKSLPCLHTFCLKCIEGHMERRLTHSSFACPTCRKEIYIPAKGVADFPTNFHFVSLMDAMKETHNSVVCKVCQQEGNNTAATFVCEVCSENLCHSCSEGHQKYMRGHTVKHLENAHQHSTEVVELHCRNHPGHKVVIHCLDCHQVLCGKCATDHYNHRSERIEKCINDANLGTLGACISHKMEFLQSCLCTTNTNIIRWKQVQDQINSRHQKSLQAIKDPAEAVLQLVKVKLKADNDIKQSLDYDVGELQSLAGQLERKNYALNAISCQKKMSLCLQIKEKSGCFQEVTHPLQNIQLGGNVDVKLEYPIVEWKKLQLISTMVTSLPQDKSISDPVKMAINPRNNNIVVTDKNNGKVKTFSTNGIFIHSETAARCSNEYMVQYNIPWGVTYASDLQVVANHQSGEIFFFSPDFKVHAIMNVECCRDIVANDEGDLYATASENPPGIRFIPGMGRLGEAYDLTLYQNGVYFVLKNPYYICRGGKDELIVTDPGCESLFIIKIDGTVLHSYGRYGHGPNEFNHICGVCVDRQGNIIVADRLHNRLHLLTPKAEFICHLLDEGEIKLPRVVMFDQDGYLLVSESCTSIIKKFSYHVIRLT